ncbi:sigma 54 modulation/S30EA ribosomal C-terminal domain-containing protein [Pseudonocardia bannensis]|uniref:HPF/RaiA family ribosome-associated protein n=1 Tax=Pseudonocardia bannensis TaxID=630973 RepID=A0A848DT72_9PSEU|nr:sigma 54 modulation/S30EA ribosomal C-terminal domain-containing protein [Pseudonocardia bannensis]NMH95571.1 HPF/RaiA family ribosome-associated protein [Pseudonocardia bannensis]
MRRAQETTASVPVVETAGYGDLPTGALGYLRRKIVALLRLVPEPVPGVRIRLTRLTDPTVTPPVIAQANVDLGDRILRVQVTADTAGEAADLLAARLRPRLERAAARHSPRRRAAEPSAGAAAPAGTAPVLRRKSYTLARRTVDEALAEMDELDYDFHLFTEVGSGQDCVLYHDVAGPRLAQLHPQPDRIAPHIAAVSVSSHPAPVLSLEQASHRLALSGLPFLFYRDRETDRGHLLYRRYDGNCGVVTPAG